MKRILMMMLIMVAGNVFSQSDKQYATTEFLMSPFEAASKIIQSGKNVISSKKGVSKSIQHRGVAGKEQLRDELVALNDDMAKGYAKNLEDIRQPGLRELFSEIAQNQSQMEEVNSTVTSGSELHRIATMVTLELLGN